MYVLLQLLIFVQSGDWSNVYDLEIRIMEEVHSSIVCEQLESGVTASDWE